MKRLLMIVISLTVIAMADAQENLPTDYLAKTFHAGRRDAFRKMMPAGSVAVIFAYPERNFSNDVNYTYHQNPDLYYLTGYTEPDAVLLIFKDQQNAGDSSYNELFFVRRRDDPAQETWTGRRLGVEGVKKNLGFTHVYEGKSFTSFPIDFSKFKTIIYDEIATDVRNDASGYDLSALITSFVQKAGIKSINKALHDALEAFAQYITAATLPRYINYIQPKLNDPAFQQDSLIREILANPDSIKIQAIKEKINTQRTGPDWFAEITNALREIKTPEEMVLLRKAVKISSIAHAEAMKAIRPNMSEHEIEGVLTFVHKLYGAEEEGYPPIVGAGANGCILHYEENSSTRINNQLLLMDVGSEYHGYSADVTRTVPATGKYTPEEKAIYQLVYDAQEAVMKLCKEGVPFGSLNEKATAVLSKGLMTLGIIKNDSETINYYPHGCSHHLGLDVHDKSAYGPLKENMVITVEPGIYIPAGSKCDKKWWNIGVRIEDDVRIGKLQCEILSADAPRKWQDVEKKCAEASRFKNFTLPAL